MKTRIKHFSLRLWSLFILLIISGTFISRAVDNAVDEGIASFNDKNYVEAYKKLLPEAQKGDVEAQYYVGRILLQEGNRYSFYNYVPEFSKLKEKKRIEEIKKQGTDWLRKSIWKDHIPALVWGGKEFTRSGKGQRDEIQGAGWLQRAVTLGDTEAMILLANCYYHGTGVERDRGKAKELLEKAAEKGDGQAMFNLYVRYGDPTESYWDKEKSLQWLDRAVAAGNKDAFRKMGDFYRDGSGGRPKNLDRAIYWYEKAESPYLKDQIAQLNAQKEEEKEKKAFEFLTPVQAYNKGKEYYDSQNYSKALPYMQKAADGGDANGLFCLGYMHTYGHGVAKDYRKAMDYYVKASNKGNSAAMVNIGWLYEHGYGVGSDFSQALKWYESASKKGNAKGKENYQKLSKYIKEEEAKKAAREKQLAAQRKAAANSASRSGGGNSSSASGNTSRQMHVEHAGGYTDYNFREDGSLVSKMVSTCFICHGSGVCGICGGRGAVYQPYFNSWNPCSYCLQTGKCPPCKGTGRTEIVAYSDAAGNSYAVGKDGKVTYGSASGSSSGSSGRSSSSSAGTCDRCGGLGVDKFPVYEEDPAGAGSHAVGMVGYTNHRGTKCQYCGKYNWHIHTKCTKCGYR